VREICPKGISLPSWCELVTRFFSNFAQGYVLNFLRWSAALIVDLTRLASPKLPGGSGSFLVNQNDFAVARHRGDYDGRLRCTIVHARGSGAQVFAIIGHNFQMRVGEMALGRYTFPAGLFHAGDCSGRCPQRQHCSDVRRANAEALGMPLQPWRASGLICAATS